MNDRDSQRVGDFLNKWLGSEGNERANYQTFFGDLCVALDVPAPPPKGSEAGDKYCFDKNIKFFSEKAETTRFADFYKEGHFLIEAKQGSTNSSKGHGKRGTKGYRDEMQKAFNQAKSYAYNRMLPSLPPFLITCDIGSHFEIWQGFSGEYGSYGARQTINLKDLAQPEIFDRFVAIFTDPQSLNPEKYRARVTREVAAELAKLSRWLEEQGYEAHATANFLMRCIFTMFAEDVELLKGEVFTKALRDRWIPNPHTFKPEIEQLWQTMNTGGTFGFERILRFNGSFFEDATAFDLPKEQLEVLYAAAAKDWSQVEPAIFGTLLERALEKKERSRLGAHYTPRSYVERLVRPVVMEPLRQQWDEVELELRRILVTPEGKEPTAAQQKKAEQEITQFLTQLRQVRILDPACGTGNFLYVTLDLLKGLEQEAIARLVDVVGNVQLNVLEQVNPAQFLGIEINPRAAAIAELVIWIGYLQWYFKRYGNAAPPEPVLQAFGNIECRDAVLAYDGKEPDIDPKTGEVRSRWGGKMMKHPVTGEDVPDPSDRVVIYKYLNARAAVWPDADYIVSNPPFIGNKRMRGALGDGYVEILRSVQSEVSELSDFVMYWWHHAGKLMQKDKINSFGFITTNSISNSFNRKVIEEYLSENNSIFLKFVIPDHPWIDSSEGAAVRVSMTVCGKEHSQGKLLNIQKESYLDNGELIPIFSTKQGYIYSDLTIGANVVSMTSLKSNYRMSFQGVIPLGDGFRLNQEEIHKLGFSLDTLPDVIKPYMIGRDVVKEHQKKWIIDFHNLTKEQAYLNYPSLYQRIIELVKPSREQNNRKCRRENWWLFGENAPKLRSAISTIRKFIVTPDTSKFKPFVLVESKVLPDVQLYSIVSDDTWILGVLESSVHQYWLLKIAPRMGKGNDIRWKPSKVFDPFPFPDPTPEQKQKIRELGDRLDSHRKQVQAAHPDITITGMYNLLEKLRAGEPFTDADRAYNNRALVSTLKQIHDDLDTAVFAAYGWQDLVGKPTAEITETILERLVALNAERAAEERNGHIRWLRPEYQAPEQVQSTQTTLEGIGDEAETGIIPVEQQKWSNQPKDQLAAIRDLLRSSSGEWTVAQIANQFTGKNTQKKLDAISENLDRLEWFGLLVKREDAGITYWQYAELQPTA